MGELNPTFDYLETIGSVSDGTLTITAREFSGYVLPALSTTPVREGVIFTIERTHTTEEMYHTYQEISHLSNESNYHKKESLDASNPCDYCGKLNGTEVYMIDPLNSDEVYDLTSLHSECKENFVSVMKQATGKFNSDFLSTEI